MAYIRTTWIDEVLAGAERFDVEDNVGTPIHSNVQIKLATGVTVAGTPIDAANLNKIEQALEDAHADGFVTSGKIGTGAVVEAKIGTDAVTSGKIGTGAVVEAKIGTGAVTSSKIGASAVIAGKIGIGGVSAAAQLADGIVSQAKLAPGASKVTNRQGGSATEWYTAGSTNYAPATAKIQAGVRAVTSTATITFPVEFGYPPLVLVSIYNAAARFAVVVSAERISFRVDVFDYTGAYATANVHWLAIGPE